ncbi:MAG TPA: NADPH-dependent 7-cyano-7-deazaguanine reductase QueF [Desulfomonilia bacterium]
MKEILLGKKIEGKRRRDAGILYPVKRPEPRVMMHGFDIWRAYEISWLNPKGCSVAGIMELTYPIKSANIVESKSLKLYLNGMAFERFDSKDEFITTIKNDLQPVLVSPWIEVRIYEGDDLEAILPSKIDGICIDGLDTGISIYKPDPGLLKTSNEWASQRLVSNLLHTNCPITSQPDWATVVVDYTGPEISHHSLLAYICSFRDHEDFAEACCEKIFADISVACAPERLVVQCLYTRRGGIDINPLRSSNDIRSEDVKPVRHIRQ